MVKRLIIKNHQKEKKLFQRRLLVAIIFIISLTLLLIIRLIYLQVYNHTLFTTLSIQNHLSLVPIPPNRGAIYDRNGVLLAKNIPTFSLQLIPEKIKNLDTTIAALKTIMPISEQDRSSFDKQLKQKRRYEAITLRTFLTEEEIARFYVNQHFFPGVTIQSELIRHYPLGETLVDVLGYVGRINEDELKKVDLRNYLATRFIGKVGIEKFYEDSLHGKIGYKHVEIDASGRIVRTLKSHTPVHGDTLYLTIDSHLQQAAKEALKGLKGAIVAIEPTTGEVLTLVSNPSYDPNPFVTGISKNDYQKLQSSPDRPLYNRAIRGQYPLGSIIKPFVGLAALENGVIRSTDKIYDPGWFKFKNSSHLYRDWKKGGHGHVDFTKAIMVSCNIYFYELAIQLGIAQLKQIMKGFGFGEFTGIDLGEELPGLVPTPEWKKSTHKTAWYPGDTVLSGIGQGYMLATPLQMAMATAGLANHGQLFYPHLLIKKQASNGTLEYQMDDPLPALFFSPNHWDTVIHAMQEVVRNPQGTGYRYGKPGYTIAGKTGTAQLIRKRDNLTKPMPDNLKDNSVFIAFAPVESPQIAIAVVVENSTLAPNVARKVIDNYLLRETAS